MPCPHLDDPARLPEVDELVEPVVDLLNLDADHVPEPGQVLAGGHEGILVAGDVLEYLQFILSTCRKSIFLSCRYKLLNY